MTYELNYVRAFDSAVVSHNTCQQRLVTYLHTIEDMIIGRTGTLSRRMIP